MHQAPVFLNESVIKVYFFAFLEVAIQPAWKNDDLYFLFSLFQLFTMYDIIYKHFIFHHEYTFISYLNTIITIVQLMLQTVINVSLKTYFEFLFLLQ